MRITLKLGDTFTSISCKATFSLARILDKEGGKKVSNPYYEWKYSDSEKVFHNRIEDIEKALKFKNWIKI